MVQMSLTRRSEQRRSDDLEFVVVNKKSSDGTTLKQKSSSLVAREKPIKKEKEETISSVIKQLKETKLRNEYIRNALSVSAHELPMEALNVEIEKNSEQLVKLQVNVSNICFMFQFFNNLN